MFCELCASYKDTERAIIITDGGDKFDGQLCEDCRIGREVCYKCDMLLPSHKEDCSVSVPV